MLAHVETKGPLRELRDKLREDPDVAGLYVVEEYGERHVWVLLRPWTTEARYQVYDAEEEADPTYSLHLPVVDDGAAIRPDGTPVR